MLTLFDSGGKRRGVMRSICFELKLVHSRTPMQVSFCKRDFSTMIMSIPSYPPIPSQAALVHT